MPVTITECECKRCGYRWMPRTAEPKVCPRCHSMKYLSPREPKKGEVKK